MPIESSRCAMGSLSAIIDLPAFSSSREMLTITEPATMITDYFLAMASLVFGVLLLRLRTRRREMSLLLWGIGFLASALAAIFGGTYHGFALYFSDPRHRATWNLTMLLIG